ncbi:hypothetical protein D3C80_1354040 [compost metagenome]
MAGAHHQGHGFAVQVLEDQALDLRAVGHPPDHQVQLADLELGQQLGAGAAGDLDHQRTVTGVQAGDGFGQQPAFHRRQRPDAHLTALQFAAAHHAHAVAQGLHAGAGVAQEGLAGGSEHHPALAALEQRVAEDLLELLEGLGDGRLAHRQAVGSPGEAALAGDFEKAGEMAELDAVVDVHRRSGLTGGGLRLWHSLASGQSPCLDSQAPFAFC